MMKITGLSYLVKWENLHNWWLTKLFFAPLYAQQIARYCHLCIMLSCPTDTWEGGNVINLPDGAGQGWVKLMFIQSFSTVMCSSGNVYLEMYISSSSSSYISDISDQPTS